ncbi:hypothetical protein QEH42_gp203 [Microbacterium phage Pumpernickel]|uniref:Uncharacterized protein n=1 Tax=Microbacterium phage Pumpernickel TaxID=2885983 RepID=A0AAE8Y7N3_9CAUD|nr:hypothetical protein QEH42_gp203 [Microbacterium phage Pumpernickel]UDL16015.1 hypothetical protein SEA_PUMPERNICKEL_265 [Microbacterium phage Pumpernickel]
MDEMSNEEKAEAFHRIAGIFEEQNITPNEAFGLLVGTLAGLEAIYPNIVEVVLANLQLGREAVILSHLEKDFND